MIARVFAAVRPPRPVRGLLAEVRRSAGRDLRWVPVEQLHVTLRFWAAVDVDVVDGALATARLPAGEARIGAGAVRLGRDAVVLPVEGLDALAAAVRTATDPVAGVDGRRFVGHLTLGRLRRRSAPTAVAAVTDVVRAGLGEDGLVVSVTEVELVTSELGPGGATHRTVARYPTGG